MIEDVCLNVPGIACAGAGCREIVPEEKTVEAAGRSRSVWFLKSIPNLVLHAGTLTIPELEQPKANVLNTLASVHSRRSYAFAIDGSIAWYCSEARVDVQSHRWCCKRFRRDSTCSRRMQPGLGSYEPPCWLPRPAHDAIPFSRLEQDVSCFGVTFAISPGLKVVRDSGGVSTENGWTRQIWSPGAALASRKPEASDSRHFLRRRVIT